MTIIAITLERYFVICGSFKVSCKLFFQNKSIPKNFKNFFFIKVRYFFTKKTSAYVLVSIWCTSILISMPYLWMANYITDPKQCHLNMEKFHLVYVYSINILFIFIPTLSLTVLYIIMIVKIKKISKNFYSSDNPSNITTKTDLNSNFNNEKILIHRQSSACYFESNNKKLKSSKHVKLHKNNDTISPPKLKVVFKKYPHRNSERQSSRERIYLIQNKISINNNEIDENDSKSNVRKLSFTIVLTVVFFCCQLPIRIFICWANWKNNFSPILMDDHETESTEDFYHIDLISRSTTLIYFLHCVSNPIIYNALSIKFRNAFIFIVKNLFSFKFY